MSYKKAPSIKHQEKTKKQRLSKKLSEKQIEQFYKNMNPKMRIEFEKALSESVIAHKKQQN